MYHHHTGRNASATGNDSGSLLSCQGEGLQRVFSARSVTKMSTGKQPFGLLRAAAGPGSQGFFGGTGKRSLSPAFAAWQTQTAQSDGLRHCVVASDNEQGGILMNRRSLLQTATAGALSAAARAVEGRPPEEVAKDEDYWAEIRNAFSIDRNIVNFNNGYCSPAPRVVQDAMRRYLDYSDMGPWHTMVNVLYRQVEAVRRGLAAAAGCDPEEMAITRNSSEALENAQYGVELKSGD